MKLDIKTPPHRGALPHPASSSSSSTTTAGSSTRDPDPPTVAATRTKPQANPLAAVPITQRHVALPVAGGAASRPPWVAAIQALDQPPTPVQVRALCDALEGADRSNLAMASQALRTWFQETGAADMQGAALQDLLRDVFASVLRNPQARQGTWADRLFDLAQDLRGTFWPPSLLFVVEILALSPNATPRVLAQLVRAASRVPDDLAMPVLGEILKYPGQYLQHSVDRASFLPVIRTLVGTSTQRLESALQPASLDPAFRVAAPLPWMKQGGTAAGQSTMDLLRAWRQDDAHGIEVRKALVREVLADGQTISVRRHEALLTAFLHDFERPGSVASSGPALHPSRWLMASLDTRSQAAWPRVRSALAGMLPRLTTTNAGWGTTPGTYRQAQAALAQLPQALQPVAQAWLHASLVAIDSSMEFLPDPTVLACQKALIAAEATLDDAALTYALVGIEVGLGRAGSHGPRGAHRLSCWPQLVAALAAQTAIAERLQRCREQAVRLVSRPTELLALPGLTDIDRLHLLEILLLPLGGGEPRVMEPAVVSLDPYHALGRFRAPLLVLASLDHQTELGVEAFARVHAALLDRVHPAGKPPADTRQAGGAKSQASLDEEPDDSAPMAQALGAWRLDGVAKGFTQAIADQWAFLQNHQETSGLFYLFGHRPQDLRADFIAAHRSRIEHTLRQMDVAMRQVRKRFPRGSEEAHYLIQPLDQFARALRAGLKRIGVEPVAQDSHSRADSKRPEGPAQGPDPAKPATL